MPAARFWKITDRPIDPCKLLSETGTDADGARILFAGAVRNHADGRAVDGISYHAYREMAEKVLSEIVAEAADELGSGSVAAAHRTGELAVGEVSVAIVVAAPHRGEAYRTSRRVIEEIKLRLPVWKRESYVGGDDAWVAGAVPETFPQPERSPQG